MNLTVNARDAMPGDGRLTIATANADVTGLHADARTELSPGRYVTISVCDTGGGMTPDIVERIFEPFFTTKEKDKGTGLGMSVVYGIVKQSDGHIEVNSRPGAGAVFKIYLPRVQEEVSQPAAREKSSHELVGDRTILVVKDEVQVRNPMDCIRREMGCRATQHRIRQTMIRGNRDAGLRIPP